MGAIFFRTLVQHMFGALSFTPAFVVFALPSAADIFASLLLLTIMQLVHGAALARAAPLLASPTYPRVQFRKLRARSFCTTPEVVL
jgi:hypothetical protein